MKKFTALLIGMLAAVALNAQDIAGSWSGKFTYPEGSLTVVFHIESTGSGYTSTLDSPDQNAFGIPVDSTFFKAPELTLKATSLDFVYRGTLKDPNNIEGSFTQMGQTFDLNMTRQEE